MNRATRIILAIYCLTVFLSCIFVPWRFGWSLEGNRDQYTYFIGYRPFWSRPPAWQVRQRVPGFQPPRRELSGRLVVGDVDDDEIENSYPPPVIDWQRIGLEIGALTALCGFALILARPSS